MEGKIQKIKTIKKDEYFDEDKEDNIHTILVRHKELIETWKE